MSEEDEYLIKSFCRGGYENYTTKLTYKERYDIWISNNYETGVEYNCDENNSVNFDHPYYEPTPKYKIYL